MKLHNFRNPVHHMSFPERGMNSKLNEYTFIGSSSVNSTTAQMAHFSFQYYFTIPNSEFRNLHYEFQNSELWSVMWASGNR